MLVGAPLDQNRQPGTNRSGALWQCPLTTYTKDCTQVITDGRFSMFICISLIHVITVYLMYHCDNLKYVVLSKQ